MSRFTQVFVWVIKGLGVLVLFLLIGFATLMFVSRQEKELSREFFEHLSHNRFEDAYAMFTQETQAAYPLQQMREDFRDIGFYKDISFTQVKTSTNEGTVLSGQASTDQECTSSFRIRFVAERIMQIDISPLCLAEERST